MTNFEPVSSSNIVAAAFDGIDKIQIRFTNGVYQYEGASADLYAKFQSTFQTKNSSGKFFNEFIKPLKFSKIA